jgi:hypothetical protein
VAISIICFFKNKGVVKARKKKVKQNLEYDDILTNNIIKNTMEIRMPLPVVIEKPVVSKPPRNLKRISTLKSTRIRLPELNKAIQLPKKEELNPQR